MGRDGTVRKRDGIMGRDGRVGKRNGPMKRELGRCGRDMGEWEVVGQ